MKAGKVRPIALVIFRSEDQIFVTEYFDTVKQQVFYRPLGGKIEFGEQASETVVREVDEEIGQAISVTRSLGVLESLFSFNGQKGHEIILLFEGTFADPQMYAVDTMKGVEGSRKMFTVKWLPLEFFRQGKSPLYPEGLIELLDSQ